MEKLSASTSCRAPLHFRLIEAKPANPRLRLRVTAAAESALRAGHPWLFSDSVREQNRAGENGELAVVYDRRDRFLALGLYDPASPLRLRVLHAGKPVTVDAAWWRDRLRAALARRAGLFGADTTGYRWIYGESDGWPGLVLDRYADTLVLKLYTATWLPRLDEIAHLIRDELAPARIILRLSRNIQAVATQDYGRREGDVLHGEPPSAPVVFLETGLRFEADVVRGQKTGFFLDQRENRRIVESLAAGRDVLNAFSFSGGFSLYAARGGARSVTDVDISPHALDSARRNWDLNEPSPQLRSCRREYVQADVFAWLGRARATRFDLVILDPPSLARREADRAGALVAYAKLARDGLALVNPGGILLAASCSAHATEAEFLAGVREAASASGRRFVELRVTAHPPDHAATFPEAHYLKAVYLQFDS